MIRLPCPANIQGFLRGLWLYCAIIVFLFIFSGCRPPAIEIKHACFDPADFNATNAFAEVKALAAIAPRPSGSAKAQAAADYLVSKLRALGLEASVDAFDEDTPSGRVRFRNVTGVLRAGEPGGQTNAWLVVGAHYDTKAGIADNFLGVNDSSSGAGVVLEMAHVIKACPPTNCNLLFVFFDGEECRVEYGKKDGLHGSRRLAKQLTRDGRAGKVKAVVILDMVGDRDLTVTIPRNGSSELISGLFKAAEAEGTRSSFAFAKVEILDDHMPFVWAGMPALDVIDFEYGSAPGQNDYWHTPADTLDKISAESLGVVGRTVLRLMKNLALTPQH